MPNAATHPPTPNPRLKPPLTTCSEAGEVPHFQFVEINGLRLPSPQHAYSALYEVSAQRAGQGLGRAEAWWLGQAAGMALPKKL